MRKSKWQLSQIKRWITFLYFNILSYVNTTLVTYSDRQLKNTTLLTTEINTSTQSTGESRQLYFFIRVKFDLDLDLFFIFFLLLSRQKKNSHQPATTKNSLCGRERHHAVDWWIPVNLYSKFWFYWWASFSLRLTNSKIFSDHLF